VRKGDEIRESKSGEGRDNKRKGEIIREKKSEKGIGEDNGRVRKE
jgi:hypothetical protein